MARGPGRPKKEKPAYPVETPDGPQNPEPDFTAVPTTDGLGTPGHLRQEQVRAQEPHPSDVEPLVSREAAQQVRDDTRQGEGRQERKPLGVARQRLAAKVPSGMTGRWMNDVPGRLVQALEGGYQFIGDDAEVVQDRSGCRSEIVGTGRDGGAMRAYLMAIPTVLYERDQAAKQGQIDQVDEAIRRGIPQQVAPKDKGAFYTPDEGISLRSETR